MPRGPGSTGLMRTLRIREGPDSVRSGSEEQFVPHQLQLTGGDHGQHDQSVQALREPDLQGTADRPLRQRHRAALHVPRYAFHPREVRGLDQGRAQPPTAARDRDVRRAVPPEERIMLFWLEWILTRGYFITTTYLWIDSGHWTWPDLAFLWLSPIPVRIRGRYYGLGRNDG